MRIKMTIRFEESNSKITSSLRKIHLKLYRVAKTKFLESLYIARVSLSKCIKRRSDGEISSVERGNKRLKSQKKKKKRKTRIGKFKIFDRASILRIEI